MEHAEDLLRATGAIGSGTLYDVDNVGILHHINQSLKAHHLFKCDINYMLKDGQVLIIDEFTGRTMLGASQMACIKPLKPRKS